jgi:hypothetical protein
MKKNILITFTAGLLALGAPAGTAGKNEKHEP